MKVRKRFIVKVQMPLISNDPNPGALVYDKKRIEFDDVVPIDDNIVRAMRGRPKAFFYAGWAGDTFVLATESEAPWQSW